MINITVPAPIASNSIWTVSPLEHWRLTDRGFAFEPMTADGSDVPSISRSYRAPFDVKPKQRHAGLYGEKPVYHLQHHADLSYRYDTLVQSNVTRRATGQWKSTTKRTWDWTSKSVTQLYNLWAYRDGATICEVEMTSTESMWNNVVSFSRLSVKRHSLVTRTPKPNKPTDSFEVTVATEETIITPRKGGSANIGLTSSEVRAMHSDLPGLLQHIAEKVPIASSTSSRTRGKTAYYLTVKALPQSATALVSNAVRTLSSVLSAPKTKSYSNKMKSYGELAGEAAATADSNAANMIAFVRDLKDIKSLVPKLKNLSSIQTHASNYLAVNYGILPTIGDLNSIHAALNKAHWTDSFGNQVLTAGQTVTESHGNIKLTTTRRVKLTVSNEDDKFSKAVKTMRSSGFYPSPQNLWDLIPYSFVVDWFVDIGSFLERFDSGIRLGELPILACTSSQKSEYDISALLRSLLPGFTVKASIVSYTRNVSSNPPRVPLTFNSELTAQDHLIEGSALILTRTRAK